MPRRLYNTLATYTHIVILCFCWYIISSFGSQVTKKILTLCPLPLFLGEFQFIYTALLAVIVCFIANKFPRFYSIFPEGTFPKYSNNFSNGDHQSSIITKPSKHVFKTVLPLGLFQFVGKFFGHKATSLVPVSTVASIKTLSPVFILLIQKAIGISTLQLSSGIFGSLASLIVGVWIIVGEDSNSKNSASKVRDFSLFGIVCAVISMFIFVFQNLYGKKVFTYRSDPTTILPKVHSTDSIKENSPFPNHTPVKETKYDKLTLMIYISTVGFLLSFGWFLLFELPIVLAYLSGDKTTVIKDIPWQLLLLNGTFHFMQAMITFHLLGELSTLTYSIANLMKRIAIISVSWIFTGRQITLNQIFGLLLNAFGLFLYERLTSNGKKLIHNK
ncbi:hypothetical protein Kpol_2002p53 [Vanderwaltozyma polyspora DSM 70294]|uniref:Sugar phosphate transporter domain-containing protein n=1 Tax=Vanderwaltozyma polyspora (strain ATCC 22028 / DSM 70294 / BCRC 21397 / CBS 2163 / NBRC 10782 / NRRL Y-8283 / UCD 57-17) TaxID=436907 RepID=A7TFG8_VANPO|nr:uncharacterized protein Kpol_2002p53 [Vanderwaltozyma polyspora DSM 70294]EDO18982.1 hypothetical protein Kpol_2002p53 [Vanderwaltozyma polyspora DSM 70294]